jgi:hypothetical protein
MFARVALMDYGGVVILQPTCTQLKISSYQHEGFDSKQVRYAMDIPYSFVMVNG